MNIKLDLIKDHVADLVVNQIHNLDIDVNCIASTKAMAMLSEIQAVIQNPELEFYEMIMTISDIFYDNGMVGAEWM